MSDRRRPVTAAKLRSRVLGYAREHALLPEETRLLLAVSGGPDSLALLSILGQPNVSSGAPPIVAYIDHGVRAADEVASERAFVQKQAHAAGLTFVSAKLESSSELGRSPEEALRRGRYRALARLAIEAGADRVATGHTRSDQAETVLLRLLRGTGLNGLAAMRPVARWPLPSPEAPLLIRPLLCLSRTETVSYCAALGLSPRQDPENANPRYRRNRVRAELLPMLAGFNPHVEETLAVLAEDAALWREALNHADRPPAWRESGGDLIADLAVLRGMDPARRTLALRAMVAAGDPEQPQPSRAHLEALGRLVAGGAGARVSLPSGRVAIREYHALRITSRAAGPTPLFGPDRAVIAPSEFVVAGWRIGAWLETVAGEAYDRQQDRMRVRLNPALAEGLTVGRRRPGDRIAMLDMSGHTTLQNLFINARIPRDERERWPVFRTPQGVVWVPEVRAANWAGAAVGRPALVLEVAPEPAE